ncbi:MAG: hypothetical protein JRE82_06525 [Deltaproteobacteria bacterium]|nr:hypothetical protein [Deltaproteobacteria bacterium]
MHEGKRRAEHSDRFFGSLRLAKHLGEELEVQCAVAPDPGALCPEPVGETRQHVFQRRARSLVFVWRQYDETHFLDIRKQHVAGARPRRGIVEREVAIRVDASLGRRRTGA